MTDEESISLRDFCENKTIEFLGVICANTLRLTFTDGSYVSIRASAEETLEVDELQH